jgi:hypothetical protein
LSAYADALAALPAGGSAVYLAEGAPPAPALCGACRASVEELRAVRTAALDRPLFRFGA